MYETTVVLIVMQLFKLLRHLFLPHESNNHKAKLIHPSILFLFSLFLIFFQIILNFLPARFPDVLGYASSIDPSEIIRLTNENRAASGLAPVSQNSVLSSAALAKGQDMLAKGYWAHFAPDGTAPWSFFSKFGYKYRYAGENLARDFASADTAVAAWMNSKTHKDNILNPNYKEIGIGVVEGNLNGVDTTIVVQFFGAKQVSNPVIADVKAEEIKVPIPTPSLIPSKTAEPVTVVSLTDLPTSEHLTSPFKVTKNISLAVVGVIIFVLSLDLIIVRPQRIARISGRTLAHISYFGMILAVIIILKAGEII